MGLDKEFIFVTTAFNLSWCLRPDTQISISVRISVGNISNKDASLGWSCFEWWCSLLVLWLVCPHLVFFGVMWCCHFSEIYGVFVNDVIKKLRIDDMHMYKMQLNSYGRIYWWAIYTSVYECIFVCSVVQKFGVTWGGFLGKLLQRGWFTFIRYLCPYK